MNRDDVLKAAARGCGFDLHWHRDGKLHINMGQLERFAAAMYSAGIESAKADVLRIAGECGIVYYLTPHKTSEMHCTDSELERFATAMYAAGAEAMRERAMETVKNWKRENLLPICCDHSQHIALVECEQAISALPITPTNTEGEQG